jgi:intracellular multiplication protein IcmK
MKNTSLLLTGFLSLGLACTSTSTLALAQNVVDEASPAAQPPAQTLFQEEESKPAEAPVPAAAQATADTASDSAPPSLSDFLSKATGNDKTENKEASGDSVAIDPAMLGVDPNAPGLGLQTGQQNTDESPEVAKQKAEATLRKDAFKAATNQMMPLKPSEIRRILELYDETTQAAETPVYPSPEPESAFQTISLDPGTKPLVIKTAIGNVTTLSIVDVTGQPWPIQDLTWAGDFQIEQPEQGSHMLRITPTSQFAMGNVSMRLVGLNPPVIFSLKAERKSVHVRLDVQIPEVGPKGILPPVETAITTKAGDDYMTSVLMGVANGEGTERLKVDGVDGRTSAYNQGGMMYVRTPYTMLSPAWTKSVQSGDGMKVYALDFTPVILLSDKGKMVRAYLSHKETSDEQY